MNSLSPKSFFFNDTATTEIYTLSLHDALPISEGGHRPAHEGARGDQAHEGDEVALARIEQAQRPGVALAALFVAVERSEEHTSELQSRQYLVCRLLLEKKIHRLSEVSHSTSQY